MKEERLKEVYILYNLTIILIIQFEQYNKEEGETQIKKLEKQKDYKKLLDSQISDKNELYYNLKVKDEILPYGEFYGKEIFPINNMSTPHNSLTYVVINY